MSQPVEALKALSLLRASTGWQQEEVDAPKRYRMDWLRALSRSDRPDIVW